MHREGGMSSVKERAAGDDGWVTFGVMVRFLVLYFDKIIILPIPKNSKRFSKFSVVGTSDGAVFIFRKAADVHDVFTVMYYNSEYETTIIR